MGSEESGCAKADRRGQGPLALYADYQAEVLFAGWIAGSFLIRVIRTCVKRFTIGFILVNSELQTFYGRPKRRGTVQGNHLKEQMHAVVKTVPGPGAVYEPWTFAPKPGLRDVQVRVEATSICGTDMQIYDWHELMAKRVKPPLVMGH